MKPRRGECHPVIIKDNVNSGGWKLETFSTSSGTVCSGLGRTSSQCSHTGMGLEVRSWNLFVDAR